MSTHSIAEAKDKLSELIDRARKGEDVVITQDGEVVAQIKPVASSAVSIAERRITAEDVAWLDSHRVGGKMPKEDAGTFVSRMRDEEWAR
ncbi:MAG: type II toxin-antitoxin system prevent-host-death family antitoxin [Rhizomicrobium sp.]